MSAYAVNAARERLPPIKDAPWPELPGHASLCAFCRHYDVAEAHFCQLAFLRDRFSQKFLENAEREPIWRHHLDTCASFEERRLIPLRLVDAPMVKPGRLW